jgi:hypothetical protein
VKANADVEAKAKLTEEELIGNISTLMAAGVRARFFCMEVDNPLSDCNYTSTHKLNFDSTVQARQA